jgi:hypothetical protein
VNVTPPILIGSSAAGAGVCPKAEVARAAITGKNIFVCIESPGAVSKKLIQIQRCGK